MAKDIYRYFRVEARELLEQLGQSVLALETGVAIESTVARLLRLAHTLKGAARVVKLSAMADAAHAMEDVLTPLRDAGAQVGRGQIDVLLKLHDDMGEQLQNLEAGATPNAEAPSGRRAEELDTTLGLQADRGGVDALQDALVQAHMQVAEFQHELGRAYRAQDLAQSLRRAKVGGGGGGDSSQRVADELARSLALFTQNMEMSLHRMDRELAQVRDKVSQLRLVPAARLFPDLQRALRDAAMALGKDATFEGLGGEIRLAPEVLAAAQRALLQMVRNAVAHGIESVAQRLSLGKPLPGRVTVAVRRSGRRVQISCTDDGAGFNLAALRAELERRQGPAATSGLDNNALLQLLLRGGLSTAGSVNEFAGRGVGLDVIRDTIEQLGGEVSMDTRQGAGTTLTLSLPLSLTAVDVVRAEVAGTVVAIPLEAVRKTLRILPSDLTPGPHGGQVMVGDLALAYASLAVGMGLGTGRPADAADHRNGLVVMAGDEEVVLGVDRIIGISSVALRPLPSLMPATPLVLGISVNAPSLPLLVLDPVPLVARARSAGLPARHAQPVIRPLLVVDDSLTTRMLEQSILESAGYEVHAAVSAEDALERARRHNYALFLVDVEMPGMDGFSFVELTRADPLLRQVPALLISSRAAPEDKQRGLEAGASGYIVKSEFAQHAFLQQVRNLVQAP
ncbi:MAG: response regulator [Burkholderiaceae bacterium]|nr:response regulator [Roseateles sp.]MBV8470623.1 response regulator [Burkholderiaceae bacterium]